MKLFSESPRRMSSPSRPYFLQASCDSEDNRRFRCGSDITSRRVCQTFFLRILTGDVGHTRSAECRKCNSNFLTGVSCGIRRVTAKCHPLKIEEVNSTGFFRSQSSSVTETMLVCFFVQSNSHCVGVRKPCAVGVVRCHRRMGLVCVCVVLCVFFDPIIPLLS